MARGRRFALIAAAASARRRLGRRGLRRRQQLGLGRHDSGGGRSSLSGQIAGAGSSAQEAAQAGLDRRASRRRTPTPRSPTTRSAPAAAASSSSPAASPSAAATSALARRGADRRARSAAAASTTWSRSRSTSRRSRSSTTCRRRRHLQLSPDTLAKIFAPQDHQVERPGDRRRQPGRDAARTRAITTVNRSDESGTTENFTDYLLDGGADVWTYEPGRHVAGQGRRGRAGHLGRRRRDRAPARARSATPTRARSATSASRRSRSARVRRADAPRRRPRSSTSRPEIDRPGQDVFTYDLKRDTTSAGRLPDRARLLRRWPARSTTTPTRRRSSRAT